jgi:hypothetical protein
MELKVGGHQQHKPGLQQDPPSGGSGKVYHSRPSQISPYQLGKKITDTGRTTTGRTFGHYNNETILLVCTTRRFGFRKQTAEQHFMQNH